MVEGKTKEGFATVKSFLYHEPATFRQLLITIAQATIPYLNAQIAAGAAAVQLFDTWCGELSLADYENFALPAVQHVISGITASVPVIYYTKASSHLMSAVAVRAPMFSAWTGGPISRRCASNWAQNRASRQCGPGNSAWSGGENSRGHARSSCFVAAARVIS